MRFGSGKICITPCFPAKIACVGDFESNFTQIHDDVFVRCLVLDDGTRKLVFLAFDLLFHDRTLNDTIADYALKQYGIDPAGVTVACTHAHTAPACRGYNPGHEDPRLEALLVDRAKESLDKAIHSMMDGSLEYGFFHADFNISRRGQKDGVYDNIPDFDYPREQEFWVLCLRDSQNNIRSLLTNYACHPVFYPSRTAISGEFPARLCQLLDARYPGCTSLFFQSCAGDVRPRTTVDQQALAEGKVQWRWNTSFSDMEQFAQDMFRSVSSFVEQGGCRRIEPDFACDAFVIQLPMDPKPLSHFQNQAEAFSDYIGNPNLVNARRIAGGLYGQLETTLPLHCQTLRIAQGLWIVTLGGEPCFGVKQAIQTVFPDADLCLIGYTDACAYIVDDKILAEGGYEPGCHLEYGLVGPFLPGLDQKYRDGFSASRQRIIQ